MQTSHAYATLSRVWALLVVGLSFGPATVPAPPSGHPIEIGWEVSAGCPDAEWARTEIERLVGNALDTTRATQLSFDVEIATSDSSEFEATILTTTEGGRRSRTLTHTECQPLSEAAALIIAMAIDPAAIDAADPRTLGNVATARTVDVAPQPGPKAKNKPEPEPLPEPARESVPVPERPRPARAGRFADRWAGPRIAFEAGFGRLPGLDLGGSGGVALGLGPLRLQALAGTWAPRTVAVGNDGDTRYWAWSVGLRAGWAFEVSPRVEIPLLVGVDLGQVRARGRGLQRPATASPPLGHAHLVPSVVVWVHPSVALLAEIDAAVPWARPRFEVSGHGTVFRAPLMGVHGGIGVVARFPRRPASGNGA